MTTESQSHHGTAYGCSVRKLRAQLLAGYVSFHGFDITDSQAAARKRSDEDYAHAHLAHSL